MANQGEGQRRDGGQAAAVGQEVVRQCDRPVTAATAADQDGDDLGVRERCAADSEKPCCRCKVLTASVPGAATS
jgi:hypothetical protein